MDTKNVNTQRVDAGASNTYPLNTQSTPSPTATADRETLAGLFPNAAQAEEAITDLLLGGFSEDQISVAMAHHGDQQDLANRLDVHSAGDGTDPGAVLQSIVNIFKGDHGDNGLLGDLKREGIPEDEARAYSEALRQGNILVIVQAGLRAPDALAILRQNDCEPNTASQPFPAQPT
ncbi:general stress protein [Candidatus Cyanaurora vandensis]|uniref:general stress protein n=1 Tax=Candidatus Cyanaurora vandensis TaxID=2714958 RepID=UPI00257C501D|nr:general stress protein [Candidatus Cyanaurora vandensis]